METRDGWNHNVHYHDFILRSLPGRCGKALDVGCGDGLLARKLAERCDEVVAVDVDHDSLVSAREGVRVQSRIEYVEADVMACPFAEESFDCITAVATLHHLPLEAGLIRFRRLLKPGGVLVVVGLYRLSTVADYAFAATALPVSRALRVLRGYGEVAAPLAQPRATLREIRAASEALLSGSVLRRRLLFRYTLVWRKA
jgi:ubiquinone/menaquinone biosynthesis C-methylase UbiE